MKTMKVKPWGPGQGEYVLINEEDFDEKRHILYEQTEEPQTAPRIAKKKKKRKKVTRRA